MMIIHTIPMFTDNYVFILQDPQTNDCWIIDPGEAETPLNFAKVRGWQIKGILNTHHHSDHIGGNLAIQQATAAIIFGNQADSHRHPGLTHGLAEGDIINLAGHEFIVIGVAGHTKGHIAYYSQSLDALFCGDALFVMGCGRLFEGTPAEAWESLQKLRALPPSTKIYCAHEYSLSNAQFALAMLPADLPIQKRHDSIQDRRSQNLATIPALMGEEMAANPFLRADEVGMAGKLGLPSDSTSLAIFTHLRQAKDRF